MCMVMSLSVYGPRHSPYSNYLCRERDTAAGGNIFNVFSYDMVRSEIRIYHLPDD